MELLELAVIVALASLCSWLLCGPLHPERVKEKWGKILNKSKKLHAPGAHRDDRKS